MGKSERLTDSSQFAEVAGRGKTRACRLIVLKTLPNGLERNRYGFVASKRVGKAVVRNRVKRLLREAARSIPMKSGWDIVFIARIGAAGASYRDIETAVTKLLGRSGILADENKDE
jgi:ribonuclease P protein component